MSFTQQRYSVDLYKSRLLLSDFVDQYNGPAPKEGGKRLGERLRQPHVHLAEMLQELQHREVMRAQNGHLHLVPNEELPRFYTSNVYLAKRMKCSKRKVGYLMSRLQEAGLIADYVWHGRQAEYEVRLSNKVIFLFWDTDYYRKHRSQRTNVVSIFSKRATPPPTTKLKVALTPALVTLTELYMSDGWALLPAAQQDALCAKCGINTSDLAAIASSPQMQTLRPNSSCSSFELETTKLNKSSGANSPAENAGNDLQSLSPPPTSHPANVAGNQPETGAGNETNAKQPSRDGQKGSEQETKNSARRPGELPATAPETLEEAAAHLSTADRMELKRLVNVLWKQAVRLIYDHQGTWLADNQETRGKARLAEYFCYHAPAKWEAQRKEMTRRIMLVRRWLDGQERTAKRFKKDFNYRIALPATYFDVRRPKQFVATKRWYADDVRSRWEIQRGKKLARACKEYEKAIQPNSGLDVKAIYRKWHHALDRLGKEVLAEFHQHINDFTNEEFTTHHPETAGESAPAQKQAG